jgi:hypothetical protein
VKCVKDEGMPLHKNPFVKGKLYIKFQILPFTRLANPHFGEKQTFIGGAEGDLKRRERECV